MVFSDEQSLKQKAGMVSRLPPKITLFNLLQWENAYSPKSWMEGGITIDSKLEQFEKVFAAIILQSGWKEKEETLLSFKETSTMKGFDLLPK